MVCPEWIIDGSSGYRHGYVRSHWDGYLFQLPDLFKSEQKESRDHHGHCPDHGQGTFDRVTIHEQGDHEDRHRSQTVFQHVKAGDPPPEGVWHQALNQGVVTYDKAALGDAEDHQHAQG